MKRIVEYSLILLFLALGCTTLSQRTSAGRLPAAQGESSQEVAEAINAVAGAMTYNRVESKYCPKCGRHYSSRLEICPEDETTLKLVE